MRRRYRSPVPLLRDLAFVLRNAHRLRSPLVSPALRERLMLVVTAVNRCRYCAYAHARLALRAGVPGEEIQHLLGGRVREAPAYEVPALVYAQHWAESDGRPDREARRALKMEYGAATAEAIEVLLRAIRIGNLAGNAWDEALCSLSHGRLGCDDRRGGAP